MTETDAGGDRRAGGARSRIALAGVAISLLVAVGTHPQTAVAASTFDAVASTDLVRVAVNLQPAVLQSDIVDAGALTTQARLTSLGDSDAFASTPYPGSLATAVPGLADGVLALPVDLPDYPLLASSSFPSKAHDDVDVGTLNMTADSDEDRSDARVNDGANSARASVNVDPNTDVVVAAAETTLGSFRVGPQLAIGGVRSSATVTRSADGKLERKSEFSIASLTVLGQQVRVTPTGLELPGSSVPVNAGSALDPLGDLLSSLRKQGLSLRVLDAQDTADGVISAGLEIARTLDTGINGTVATLTLTFGRVSTSVSGKVGSSSALDALPVEDTSFGGPTSDATGALSPLPAADAFGTTSALAPTPAATQPRSSAPTAMPASPVSAISPEVAHGGRFYPVLVLAAVAMVAVVDLFRKRGVKLTWLS